MSYTYSLTIHIGHSWSKYNLRQARSGSTGHILDQNNKKKDQEDTVQRRGTDIKYKRKLIMESRS